MDTDDQQGDVMPKDSSGEQAEGEQGVSPEDALKKLLESGDEQAASRLSGLLANLQPQEEQPGLEASRAGAAEESGLNLGGLLKAPGIRDTLIKLLAEKLNLPASSVEALVGLLGKEKKKAKKKASTTAAKKRKSAATRRTSSSAKTKKKSTASAKKTAAKRSTTKKSVSTKAKPKSKKTASKKSGASTTTKKRRAKS